jgi:PucR C-terminal helix-turn-helix domain
MEPCTDACWYIVGHQPHGEEIRLGTTPIAAEVRTIIDGVLADPVRLDRVVAELITTIREQVPAYRAIPMESLRTGNRQIMVAALGQIRDGRTPSSAELQQLHDLGRLRAEQGVDLASVLAAYQSAGHKSWQILKRELEGLGGGDAALIDVTKLIWEWLDRVTLAVATAHRSFDLQAAREDERRVADALRSLLSSPTSSSAAEQYLLQLGLPPDGSLAPFRGRPADRVTVSMIRETLDRHVEPQPPGPVAVAAMIGRDIVGLARTSDLAEVLTSELGTFGVGPAVPSSSLHRSFTSASRSLRAALRLGRLGAHRLQDLRLTAMAATEAEMTELLTERILVPLRAKGRYADEIWQAVTSYLENDLRVDAAAARLHVHTNTVRHRIAHFTDLTGLDPRRPADLAEIWWLMVQGHTPTSGLG